MQLQENSRQSFSELADKLGVSVPTVSEHVKRLEALDIIRTYTAVLNPQACGLDVAAFIFVDLDSSSQYEMFRRQCRGRKDILECHAITGTASHILKVRVKNTPALEQLLSVIQQWKGVIRTTTNVILSTAKESTALQLSND